LSQPYIVRHYGRGFAASLTVWTILGVCAIAALLIYLFVGPNDNDDPMVVVGAIALCISVLFLYTLPPIIACVTVHPSRAAIYFISWLFGWTGLGWITAMIWALAGSNARSAQIIDVDHSSVVGLNLSARASQKAESSFFMEVVTRGLAIAIAGLFVFALINKDGHTFGDLSTAISQELGTVGNSDDVESSVPRELRDDGHSPIESGRYSFRPAVTQMTMMVPGAIVCSNMATVEMLSHLYTAAWEDKFQDKLTRGQSRLLRGEGASEPKPEDYGCILLPPGTEITATSDAIVPIVRVKFPSGAKIKGVTEGVMFHYQ
jgi:Superinfection immunity protein